MPDLCECPRPQDCCASGSEPCKRSRKAILGGLRNHLKMEAKTDGEARQYWADYLKDTRNLSLEVMRLTCERVRREPGREFFPAVGVFLQHASRVRANLQERAQIASDPLPVLEAPKWTREKVEAARAAVKNPDSVLGKKLLAALAAVKVEEEV